MPMSAYGLTSAVLALAAAVLLLPAAIAVDAPFSGLAVEEPVASGPSPLLERATVSLAPRAGMLHSPSVADLGGGELVAVWFQGSWEGRRDVGLYTARFSDGEWQPAVRITDAEATGRELGRFIGTVGNAILVPRSDEELWLVYTTVSFGGWSLAHLNIKRSFDRGRTWAGAERLVASPFFNLSTNVKGRPMWTTEGATALPAYHQMIAQYPELLVIGDDRRVVDKIRMGPVSGRIAIQPSLVVLSESEAQAYMRPRGEARHTMFSRSKDGGRSWSHPREVADLPNIGGPVGAARVGLETLVIVSNYGTIGHDQLTVVRSTDSGASWQPVLALHEPRPDLERHVTYPFLTVGHDGSFHLVYADFYARAIRHVRFNAAWLNEPSEISGDD